jgi:hypothetical protein
LLLSPVRPDAVVDGVVAVVLGVAADVDGFVDDLGWGAFVGVDGGDERGVGLAYTVADGLGGAGCTGWGFARLRTALRGV